MTETTAGRGVLRDPDFRTFWVSETAGLLGMELTRIVFPLVAIYTFAATTFQVGLLQAFLYAPIILFSLFVGVWLDRRRRRPVLLAANAVRAVVLALVPVAAWAGLLSLPVLYAVVFVVGAMALLFEVGSLSYVPSLVAPDRLAEANSRIQVSFSAASIAGPSIGGVLVGAFTGPHALGVGAAGFALSAVLLAVIRKPEPMPPAAAAPAPVLASIGEGLRTVFSSPLLRQLIAQSTVFNLGQNALGVVLLVYVVRELGLTPGKLGLILGTAAVAALVSAIFATRITKAFGLGRTLRLATYGCCLPGLLLLVPRDASLGAMILLASVQAGVAFHVVIWNINTLTLRQVVTPPHVLGRMNASYRMVLYSAGPLGALLGGALGEFLGLRGALVTTTLLALLPLLWTIGSPVFRLASMPTGPLEPADPEPVAEPIGGSIGGSIAGSTAEPVAGPVAGPVAEPVAEPIAPGEGRGA